MLREGELRDGGGGGEWCANELMCCKQTEVGSLTDCGNNEKEGRQYMGKERNQKAQRDER